MITFRKLGQYGRFGNQLFQIAAAVGLAKKYKGEAGFLNWEYQRYFYYPLNFCSEHYAYLYKEERFEYQEIPYNENMEIEGYFQSERYFSHCKKYIRKIFTPKHTVVNYLQLVYSALLREDTCAIHVRRTDYIKLQKYHRLQTMDYYERAMDRFEGSKFVVFSDDIPWCKKRFKNVEFIDSGKDVYDFFLMAMCKNHIIANSSFSWWAAWLCKYKGKVIAPKDWFGKEYKDKNTKDIYCKGWTII